MGPGRRSDAGCTISRLQLVVVDWSVGAPLPGASPAPVTDTAMRSDPLPVAARGL